MLCKIMDVLQCLLKGKRSQPERIYNIWFQSYDILRKANLQIEWKIMILGLQAEGTARTGMHMWRAENVCGNETIQCDPIIVNTWLYALVKLKFKMYTSKMELLMQTHLIMRINKVNWSRSWCSHISLTWKYTLILGNFKYYILVT